MLRRCDVMGSTAIGFVERMMIMLGDYLPSIEPKPESELEPLLTCTSAGVSASAILDSQQDASRFLGLRLSDS